jgi:hypothetical protein
MTSLRNAQTADGDPPKMQGMESAIFAFIDRAPDAPSCHARPDVRQRLREGCSGGFGMAVLVVLGLLLMTQF